MRTGFFNHVQLKTVAAAVLLTAPCGAQSPDSHSVRTLPGCYRLTLGSWSMDSKLGPSSPTTVVRLDTIPRQPGIHGDLVAERIEPAEFAPPGDVRAQWERPARWRREAGDSVVIIMWSTGTEAESFLGHWKRGKLEGVVRRTSDAIIIDPITRKIRWDAYPWASASGVSIPCP
jgi:hypothetical protein